MSNKLGVFCFVTMLCLSATLNGMGVSRKPLVVEQDNNDIEGINYVVAYANTSSEKDYRNIANNGSLLEQINEPNTVYVISKDYDLSRSNLVVPTGCSIILSGGSINNGTVILSDGVRIQGNKSKCKNLVIRLIGSNVKIESVELIGSIDETVKTPTCAIEEDRRYVVGQLSIKDCIIHHYNQGISLWSCHDVDIEENVIYDIGSKTANDNEFDISLYGGSLDTYRNINIIRNKCLSRNVHRNISLGLVSSEDNILIDGNICVSCKNDLTEDPSRNYNKAHCIMVGYAGTKSSNKHCIITNNTCKHSNWGGLYLRSDNESPNYGDNAYQFIVTNNYIENIRQYNSKVTQRGGIYVETRAGSLISNNTVVDCYNGIHIGSLTNNTAVLVNANTIKNCEYGILNELVCLEYVANGNLLINCKTAITAIQYRPSGVEVNNVGFCHIVNNTIKLPNEYESNLSNSNNGGIVLYNLLTNSVLCSNNQIIGHSPSNNMFGISVTKADDVDYSVDNNQISLCTVGIELNNVALSRNTYGSVKNNRFITCKYGLSFYSATRATKNNLFICENNLYENCQYRVKDHSYYKTFFEGKRNSDGSIEIYQTNDGAFSYTLEGIKFENCPIFCVESKTFIPGDKVYCSNQTVDNNTLLLFDYAICVESKSSQSSIGKWLLYNGRMSSALMEKPWFKVKGAQVYNLDDNKMYYFNGKGWSVL